MDKPEYIQNLESKEGIFSVMVCHELKGEFLKYLNGKKLSRVYEKGLMNESNLVNFEEVIFKSQQNFYLVVQIRLREQSNQVTTAELAIAFGYRFRERRRQLRGVERTFAERREGALP